MLILRRIKVSKVILKATDLDGYLTKEDNLNLEKLEKLYTNLQGIFPHFSKKAGSRSYDKKKEELIQHYNMIGDFLFSIIKKESNIHVYPFETPEIIHGEASRVIAKLRNVNTEQPEFVYYIQRAYELLFNLAFSGKERKKKNYIIVKTPVTIPNQNYALHKIPDVDDKVTNTTTCVMLRGALLPSIIMSKEFQEYSSQNYITPFALFKIYRNDKKEEHNMEYILDLDRSYFTKKELDGKDLIFADPMNATGGSLVTIVNYLLDQNIKPKSIKFFNAISAIKGTLRIIRALKNVEIYTLWMDPVLNFRAYILPGLGDAGDRINGEDNEAYPRDIIQLIADFGSNITALYRDQIRTIEHLVLRRK
jgi:uracil phosphoribosyltransferase